jgi:hypothetical protein
MNKLFYYYMDIHEHRGEGEGLKGYPLPLKFEKGTPFPHIFLNFFLLLVKVLRLSFSTL